MHAAAVAAAAAAAATKVELSYGGRHIAFVSSSLSSARCTGQTHASDADAAIWKLAMSSCLWREGHSSRVQPLEQPLPGCGGHACC